MYGVFKYRIWILNILEIVGDFLCVRGRGGGADTAPLNVEIKKFSSPISSQIVLTPSWQQDRAVTHVRLLSTCLPWLSLKARWGQQGRSGDAGRVGCCMPSDDDSQHN